MMLSCRYLVLLEMNFQTLRSKTILADHFQTITRTKYIKLYPMVQAKVIVLVECPLTQTKTEDITCKNP
jgi:hypothetical protein